MTQASKKFSTIFCKKVKKALKKHKKVIIALYNKDKSRDTP